jgi:glycosyltransferase involved in cell wall biosynthesis
MAILCATRSGTGTRQIKMTSAFYEHFRCPDSVVNFRLTGKLSEAQAFFRFGEEVTCFGQTCGARITRDHSGQLGDALPGSDSRDGEVRLPFDADQVAQNLRWELYTGQIHNDHTKLGFHPLLRDLYYWARPLLPVPVRSILQRIRLRGATKKSFPHWPVDRTVDRLFENLMAMAIQARGAESIPFIWFWPEGKQAACILTHDVEDKIGKAFCPSLMDIDDEYGFKASFQIVPEGRYPVEPDFLQKFRDRNFEICVHDLNHDGNLYRERSQFRRRAQLINNYCKEFGTQGFRSGVLYRNLLWYGDYQFSYDMSVPNVAHLDPQGGGCCTVMPYFIGDLLEIPITATQDYSLFHILRQYSLDLWKQQIQTIVDGHGVLSFIIHPDYVIETKPQSVYRELLAYLRRQCSERNIWAALPRQIDCWWRQRNAMKLVPKSESWEVVGEGSERAQIAFASVQNGTLVYSFAPPADMLRPNRIQAIHKESSRIDGSPEMVASSGRNDASLVKFLEKPERGTLVLDPIEPAVNSTATLEEKVPEVGGGYMPARRPLRIAMIAYSFYEMDNRILRYASALAKRGDHIDVFALRRKGQPAEEVIEGVHVNRLQARALNEKNQLSFLWRICQFLLRALMQVAKQESRAHYDLLHVHSVPDFLVFSGLFPKLRGTPVILDIHDILPELYVSKFASGDKSGIFRLLVGVEQASTRFADHVIIANHIWRDRLISRGLSPDKCTVVMNYPDRSIFTRRAHSQPTHGKFLMLYPGSLNWHQGLDVAIRAFAKISKKAPHAEFHIYGDGPATKQLMELIKELGVEGQISMHAGCPLQEIPRIMESADLGIVPKRKDNFGNEAFSTKILEFMAMSVPVIVSDTMIDQYYFNNSVVKFFRSGDDNDLARCMLEMIEKPEARKLQIEIANRFVETFDWSVRQHEYLELVDRLTRNTLA